MLWENKKIYLDLFLVKFKTNEYMKFTKEEAAEKLRGILTNNGRKTLRMSERSFGKQLDDLMPLLADDEMDLDTFVGKVKGLFETMNSNAEYDKSNSIKEYLKEQEEKKKKEEEEAEKKRKEEEGKNNFNSELEKRLAELEKQLAEEKKSKNLATKKSELVSKMKEKGIDEGWANDFIGEISITEDLDIESKAESVLKMYNKYKASSGIHAFTPNTSSFSGEKDKNIFADVSEMRKPKNENQ